jgi:ATP-dependent helicase/nuclease subunit A
MSNQWTIEQEMAIDQTCGNILVSAAAGAGKTAVLVERIVRLLLNSEKPVDIDRLLVVTFTEASAAEMRERIGSSLEKEMNETGRAQLARQLVLINGASICTLHAFCLTIIRRYFYLLEIDPNFRVADNQEAILLQQEVAEDLLEEKLASQDTGISQLVAQFGSAADVNGFLANLIKIYRFAWSNPWPHNWLDNLSHTYDTENTDQQTMLEPWLNLVRSELGRVVAAVRLDLETAMELCSLPAGPASYADVLQRDIEKIGKAEAMIAAGWEQMQESWLGLSFDRLTPEKNADPDIKERVRKIRDRAKRLFGDAISRHLKRSVDDYYKETLALAPQVKLLCQLTSEFGHRFEAKKISRGILDFNDLEHLCLKILTEPVAETQSYNLSRAALELREWYEYVLVDEYQDISPVQDTILRFVSRQNEIIPNLFMVGDVKQSIYRFRQAEPGLFLSKYSLYAKENVTDGQTICLTSNFRCRANIVDAVNYLFRQLMSEETAEMVYDKAAQLVCGAEYLQATDDTVELHLVDADLMSDVSAEDHSGNIELEGTVIANRIAQLVEDKFPVFDNKQKIMRPVEYRDMAILMRATEGKANRLVETLKKAGIPSYAQLSSGYFTATEVETILSLLQVIDNPCQDIPLAAVLRSPLVGLKTEELAQVALLKENKDLYSAVLSAREHLSGVSDRVALFLKRLERWRDLSRSEALTVLVSSIYHETGFVGYVGGLKDGRQRQANLRALFERARQFNRFSRQGLFRFLRFINGLKESGDDLGTVGVQGERENVVRIMSIHKSKGLEFPVVFVCNLQKSFNIRDLHGDILLHRELGISLLITDREDQISYPSLQYNAMRLKIEKEQLAEELRVLYVALTRAREKLILTAYVKDLTESVSKWQKAARLHNISLPPALTNGARSYLDWIGMALIRHPDVAIKTETVAPILQPDTSRWLLRIWKSADVSPLKEDNKCVQVVPNLDYKLPDTHIIMEQLEYRYPYQALSSIPAKISVSELKRGRGNTTKDMDDAINWNPLPWPKPLFTEKTGKISAAEKGNLYHLVMQKLDFRMATEESGVLAQIQIMKNKGLLTDRQAECVDAADIASFFCTEVGRIALSDDTVVHREWPFTISLPIEQYTDIDLSIEGEWSVVQGVVDLLLLRADGIIVVDFKTSGATTDVKEEEYQQYQRQIRLYAQAASSILRRKVLGAYLYFFRQSLLLEVKEVEFM